MGQARMGQRGWGQSGDKADGDKADGQDERRARMDKMNGWRHMAAPGEDIGQSRPPVVDTRGLHFDQSCIIYSGGNHQQGSSLDLFEEPLAGSYAGNVRNYLLRAIVRTWLRSWELVPDMAAPGGFNYWLPVEALLDPSRYGSQYYPGRTRSTKEKTRGC
jgi:hypothetical protein